MIGKAVKHNDRSRFLKKSRNFLDGIQNNLSDGIRLGGMRQVETKVDSSLAGAAVVDDGVCQYLRVRQNDHASVGCPHLGSTQVNCQNGPIEAFHANGFSHM